MLSLVQIATRITPKDLTYKYVHSDKCTCGLCIYRGLPTVVTEMRCKCLVPDYIAMRYVGIEYGFGTFCNNCGKPHPMSLDYYHWSCDGCNKYFTYDFRRFSRLPLKQEVTLPLPYQLCEVCDDIPNAPKRPRRTTFRFN